MPPDSSDLRGNGGKRPAIRRGRTYIAAAVVAVGLVLAVWFLATPRRPAQKDLTPPATSGSPSGAAPDVPGAALERPSAPAPTGAKLTRILQPPASTVAMIDASKAQAGSTYSVVFRPYGSAPQGAAALVILVETSKPSAGVRKPFAFKGRNALVFVAPGPGRVTVGGRHKGTLTLVRRGDLLTVQLSDVKRLDR